MKRSAGPILILFAIALLGVNSCTPTADNSNSTAVTTVTPPAIQKLEVVPRPQKIVDQMTARGDQEQAKPVLKILAPADGTTVDGPNVQVRLNLSGDLKGYEPHKDPMTGTGNHIHVILDDQPYEAYYDLTQPFELKNVTTGKHLLRVFASRPWHESYKNEGSFQLAMFTVKQGGDASKPTTTATGQTLGNNNSAGNTSQAIEVDRNKQLLTYSRPKGEYKGPDADAIMIDFWLTNAKLKGDGGDYRIRYIIDDDEPRFIDKWEPVWLSGWTSGKHTVRLELLGADQYPAKNGSLNITTREISVVK